MVEAVLLPYFTIKELQQFSCLAKNYRNMLTPGAAKSVNFEYFFVNNFKELQLNGAEIAACKNFKSVLELI